MVRLLVWPVMLFCAALFPGAALAQAAPVRLVAVGDLHGDHDAWLAIARSARIIDAKGRWAGGKAVLVQSGDIVDRGPDSLKIIRHLIRLKREAAKAGGRVVVLVGNHEAMMMTDDLRYVHPGEYAAFADRQSERRRVQVYEANRAGIEAAYRTRDAAMPPAAIRDAWMKSMPPGKLEHRAAWRPGGELGRWAMGNPAVAKIGDTLFVHGGISAAYAAVPIDQINARVAAALAAGDETPGAIINDSMGPLWYRGLVTRSGADGTASSPAAAPASTAPRPTIEQEIDLVLRDYGVKRIVVGHTPTLGGIVEGAGGRLWRIDSAISSAYGGTPSYLEILGDRVVAHKVPRPPPRATR